MTRLEPALVALLAALLLSPGAARAGSRKVLVSAWDLAARPGETVTLVAKLERAGFGLARSKGRLMSALGGVWRGDLKRKTLRFYAGGELLGEARTDGDGTARLQWTPPRSGDHEIEVRFPGDSRYRAGSDRLLCSVRPAGRPTIILDIDHTISETSKWNVVRGRADDPRLPGSLGVVRELAERYDILYVSARANKFLDVTRRWLAGQDFPRNPVYLMEWKRYPTYDEARYKTDTIRRLQQTFPEIVLGIGDKDSDAEAYRALGLRALILGDTGDVSGAEPVEDWAEIRTLLLGARAENFRRLHGEAD